MGAVVRAVGGDHRLQVRAQLRSLASLSSAEVAYFTECISQTHLFVKHSLHTCTYLTLSLMHVRAGVVMDQATAAPSVPERPARCPPNAGCA